jgi:hypothetical protein
MLMVLRKRNCLQVAAKEWCYIPAPIFPVAAVQVSADERRRLPAEACRNTNSLCVWEHSLASIPGKGPFGLE